MISQAPLLLSTLKTFGFAINAPPSFSDLVVSFERYLFKGDQTGNYIHSRSMPYLLNSYWKASLLPCNRLKKLKALSE